MPAHGQKTRHLNRPPSWRRAWSVVVDPGTDLNSSERLGNKYTWFHDKYQLRTEEVVDNPPLTITFQFKPVPKLKNGGVRNDIIIEFFGYYSGAHASPHAPKFQIYDNDTTWVDITDGALTLGQSVEEHKLMTVKQADGNWWDGNDNIQIRILHPPVNGNTAHKLNVNHVGLYFAGITTTTSTTTTTTTTTTAP